MSKSLIKNVSVNPDIDDKSHFKEKIITHLSLSIFDLKNNIVNLILGLNFSKPFIANLDQIEITEKEDDEEYKNYEYGDPWGDLIRGEE